MSPLGFVFVLLILLTSVVHADDFTLTDNDHLDVTTNYDNGWLYDSSSVDVLPGGSITGYYRGGLVGGGLVAYNYSTVNISGGSVNALHVEGSVTVNISDGSVYSAYALGSSVAISGGNVGHLFADGSTTVAISGGSIDDRLYVTRLRLNGLERIKITGGTVEKLSSSIDLSGDEQLSYTTDLTLSDLATYGVHVAEGTVNHFTTSFSAFSTSSLAISGGSVENLSAYDSSTASISGGSVEDLSARNSGTVVISGGNVNYLTAYDSCTVNISEGNIKSIYTVDNGSSVAITGGTVNVFTANKLRLGDTQRVVITGGTVETLNSAIDLQGSENLNYTADLTLSDLASFGVHVADGTVNDFTTSFEIYDTSSLNVSGGTVNYLLSYDNSNVLISGGTLSTLYTSDSSIAFISGGRVNTLWALESSNITLNGFDFVLGNGLSWDGDGQMILGTGQLYGKWFGETEQWTIYIVGNDSTASIRAIPEPCSLALLGLGGLALRRRTR